MNAQLNRSAMRVLEDISHIGTDKILGGYSRPVFGSAEQSLREWFIAEAEGVGLDVEVDVNGVIWAWWGVPGPGAIVTGSHLDSVPGGGPHDGPLGVVSALLAVERMKSLGMQPQVPLAVVVFPEEEGSRFGVACLGSRLMTGSLSADRALALTDVDGISLAEAYRSAGLNPSLVGATPNRLSLIDKFVELHIEQGRGQVHLDAPVAIGESIISHGRWRLVFRGQGNHAGTTPMEDRSDPVVAAARTILDIESIARSQPPARATVGRIQPIPGGTNVIASRADMWLDVRHPQEDVTSSLVHRIEAVAKENAHLQSCSAYLLEESVSPTVHFSGSLKEELSSILGSQVPLLATGAGHDAGVLSGHVDTGMIFVRNPSGISHAPEESVEASDAEAGVIALTKTLSSLTGANS